MDDARQLEDLRKVDLLEMARARELAGRSRMTKAELIRALRDAEAAEGPKGRSRRAELQHRLRMLVDADRRCPWKSIDGHPCGLPGADGSAMCVLHAGAGIFDQAIPITGTLGFEAWPELIRHLRLASYDIDPFGLDPVIAELAWHLSNFLYFDYFRVEVEGVDYVPMEGPAVVVANHAGAALPYDGAMLQLAVMNEARLPRRVRVTGTEIFNLLPWVSHLFRKVGAVYAHPDDARALLERGHLLGVFPEGERGFMKPSTRAYQVGRLGRGGFVRAAARAEAPIVPVAIVGSEEVHPPVFVSRRLADLVRVVWPEQRVQQIAVPLNPIPLPVRWKIRFLEPILPHRLTPPDPLSLVETAEQVRTVIQENLDEMRSERPGPL